jgi:D-tyrosyl-tRNA(Tyr) deacylase
MRAVVQRVSQAKVEVDSQITGEIARGLLVLLGVERGDAHANAEAMLDKVVNLRIFPDDAGKMNLSLRDVGGALLVVSQFTLLGDCRKGRRPSFDRAAPPAEARALYEYFVARALEEGIPVSAGVFQAHMQVSLVNDGPVTLLVET